MTKNPFYNAFAALGYIILVATVMFYGIKNISHEKDTILIPVTMLSLFSFSAAIMSYTFLSQPLQLYLDGKKKEAVKLISQTIAIFGAITAITLTLLFSGVLK